ncbi:MAG: hypothetical protein VX672_10180 [Planctomycetota bacterium]|nr:hypothetical protein [Planctomycetota bacterium]
MSPHALHPPLLALLLAMPATGAGLERPDDALARVLSRPARLPSYAGSVLDADRPFWLVDREIGRVGIFGEHLESTTGGFPAGSRTTLGVTASAAPLGRPTDLLGLGVTLDDLRSWALKEDDRPTEPLGITLFYGWRVQERVVIQPTIGWEPGDDDRPDRRSVSLGVRIEF